MPTEAEKLLLLLIEDHEEEDSDFGVRCHFCRMSVSIYGDERHNEDCVFQMARTYLRSRGLLAV